MLFVFYFLQMNGLAIGGPGGTARLPVRTSLDLELDLQAFHTRLSCLQDEIARLRQLKQQLEGAKKRGEFILFLLSKVLPSLFSVLRWVHSCVIISVMMEIFVIVTIIKTLVKV